VEFLLGLHIWQKWLIFFCIKKIQLPNLLERTGSHYLSSTMIKSNLDLLDDIITHAGNVKILRLLQHGSSSWKRFKSSRVYRMRISLTLIRLALQWAL
jgi:hypothetical protein